MTRLDRGFPILAVSIGARGVGFVSVDHRLIARDEHQVSLRGRCCRHSAEGKVQWTCECLERFLLAARPQVAVVEKGAGPAHNYATHLIREKVTKLLLDRSIPVEPVSLATACERLVTGGSHQDVARRLAMRYPKLAVRLDLNNKRNVFGTLERARENRPIFAAYVLAHAAGVESIVSFARHLAATTEPPLTPSETPEPLSDLRPSP